MCRTEQTVIGKYCSVQPAEEAGSDTFNELSPGLFLSMFLWTHSEITQKPSLPLAGSLTSLNIDGLTQQTIVFLTSRLYIDTITFAWSRLDRKRQECKLLNTNEILNNICYCTCEDSHSSFLSIGENTEDNEVNKEVNTGLLGPQNKCSAIKAL